MSLSRPDISFRFINNNQNKLHTSGNMKLKDIIYNVYGRDITANLYEVNSAAENIRIEGYIGKPFVNRGNRVYENYYINGRYIKSSIINRAIEAGYKGFIMPHNYPFTVLHFTINPEIIDVNVHPTKMELRFSNNEYVYNFVYDTILSTLKGKELVAEVEADGQIMQKLNKEKELEIKETKAAFGIDRTKETEKMVQLKPESKLEPKPELKSEVKLESKPELKSEVKLESKPELKPEPTRKIELQKAMPDETKTRLPEPFETRRSEAMVKDDEQKYQAEVKVKPEQLSMFKDKLLDEDNKDNYRIIGQLFDTYWLIEFEDRFYMMDQHAAHEKVLYERMMKKIREKHIDTQMIMPPVILTLNMNEEEVLKQNMQVFTKMGYEIEEFGGSEYKVTGIPAGFPKLDYRQMLMDLLDGLMSEGRMTDMDILTEKVASMSCKAAIKGNNKISYKEAEELMDELMKADNPYNCPHGRPTLIVMSKYDIERKFKRIV